MATVHYFGPAREAVGTGREMIELEGEVSLDTFWGILIDRYPALAELQTSSRLAVDMEYADGDVRISDQSDVAVIPPVAGG